MIVIFYRSIETYNKRYDDACKIFIEKIKIAIKQAFLFSSTLLEMT